MTRKELLELEIKIGNYLSTRLSDLDNDAIDEITYTISELVLDIMEGDEVGYE